MQYTVTIFAVTESGTIKNGSNETMVIGVYVTDPCFSTTIDLTGVLPDLAPSYTVTESASVLWFDTALTSDGGTTACPAFEYTVTTQSSGSIDTDIFTLDFNIPGSESLSTYTERREDASTYDLRL